MAAEPVKYCGRGRGLVCVALLSAGAPCVLCRVCWLYLWEPLQRSRAFN